MMTLSQYLAWKKLTQSQFGDLAGLNQSTVSKLCFGGSRPSWEVAAKIEQATGGAVPVAVWAKAPKKSDKPRSKAGVA